MKPGKTLICAATPTEKNAILRGIKKSGYLDNFDILQTGVGFNNASRSLNNFLNNEKLKPRHIISSGFAGSWSENLSVGSWISAHQLWELDRTELIDHEWIVKKKYEGVFQCQLISSPKLLRKKIALEKTRQYDHPIAVDMESSAVSVVAKKHSISFEVLRMISDSPSQPLPDFLEQWTEVFLEKKLTSKIEKSFKSLFYTLKSPTGLTGFIKNGVKLRNDFELGWEKVVASFL